MTCEGQLSKKICTKPLATYWQFGYIFLADEIRTGTVNNLHIHVQKQGRY